LSPLSNSYSVCPLKREMRPTLDLDVDLWNLDRLRFPAESIGDLTGRRRPPRHRPGDPFVKGPITHAWIASACRLAGAGLPVAMALRFLCSRFRSENRWGLDAIAGGLRISPRSARRGLHAAELAGLLCVAREPGCKLTVSVLDLPEPEAGSECPPLYGPIPWAWWLPASRLPGKALQVAAACWLLAGWNRSAEFELGLSEWGELDLSRFSAARGIECLEQAGLVSVVERVGCRPVVTLNDQAR
jgi:hypothetical protein